MLPQSHERLVPLAQASEALLSPITAVGPRRRALEQASGCVVAETPRAERDHPVARVALRDGFTVVSRDTVGATPYAPVYLSAALAPVWAGDQMAAAFDAVLPPEAVNMAGLGAEILRDVPPGFESRGAGHDLASGAALVGSGTRLRPHHLALLALAGVSEVAVRVPLLDIQGSGPLAAMIAALAVAEGAEVTTDDDSAMTIVLAAPGQTATAAAASRLARAGTLAAHGLAVRPGESIALGQLASAKGSMRPAVIVPDRLDDAIAAWLLLIRPCLARLSGLSVPAQQEVLPLTRKLVSAPGMADLVLLRRTGEASWEPLAVGDLPWSAFAAAEAYAVVAAESEGLPAGAMLAGLVL